MDNQKEFEITNKHIFSMASVMIFAPLIHIILNRNEDHELSESDKNFVRGYIKYGIIIDVILLIAGILGIISVLHHFDLAFLIFVTKVLVIGSVAMIILGIFLIFSDKAIFTSQNDKPTKLYKSIKSGHIDYIFYYLPIYNFYVWYFGHKDVKSYRWIKESMIICTFWSILYIIFRENIINFIFLFIYIGRIISLIGGIDFLTDEKKEKIDKLFEQNPEEIFGYIKGSIIYFIEKIKHKGHELNDSPTVYINKAKKGYTGLFDFRKDSPMLIEYAILLIIFGFIIYHIVYLIRYEISFGLMIIPYLIVLGRYSILIANKKFVPIPILHEIGMQIAKLFKFLK